jgi:hypothetical protein
MYYWDGNKSAEAKNEVKGETLTKLERDKSVFSTKDIG